MLATVGDKFLSQEGSTNQKLARGSVRDCAVDSSFGHLVELAAAADSTLRHRRRIRKRLACAMQSSVWRLHASITAIRRIAAPLPSDGFAVNHKRVLRLMREDNLLCLRKRAFVPATTDSRHGSRVVPTWCAAW
jgi:hypothetical protein